MKSDLLERIEKLPPEKREKLLAMLRRGDVEKAQEEGIAPLAPGEDAPLSFAQQRMWFLERLEPGVAAYSLPFAARLVGALDVAAWQLAADAVVRRHPVLRTTFEERSGEPVPRLGPFRRRLLPRVDLSRLGADASAELARLAVEDALSPFDLERGPLLRMVLVRLGPCEHALLANVHHIASDGWSNGLLLEEMGLFYRARAAGREPGLPELRLTYADFAAWQQRRLEGGAIDKQMEVWRRRLMPTPPVLELPADRPRQARPALAGASVTVRLDAELCRRAEALARGADGTLFMALLAAFAVLLGRWSGQRDVAVGSAVAGRPRPELEGLVGCFVNTLVLRTDLGGDPPFRELLERVREVSLEAFANQEVPFERLVEEVSPERSLAHSPLFQVLFGLQNAPSGRLELPGLEVLPLEHGGGSAKLDLAVSLERGPDGGVEGLWFYRRELFEPATVRRLTAHFEALVRAGVEAPETRLAVLPMLSGAERQQLLVEWNDTAAAYPRETSLAALFGTRAQAAPEAEALAGGGMRLSYGELERLSSRLANHLEALGVGPETPVGLAAGRSPELVVGMLGILKAGAAYVPLDPAYPTERLRFMVEDAGVELVLRDADAALDLAALGVEDLPLAADETFLEGVSEAAPADRAGGDSLAYVIYTSGSTGRPKGIAAIQRGVSRLVLSSGYVEIAPGDRVAVTSATAFDAVTFEVWGALLHGACLVMVPHETLLSPPDLARLLEEEGVSVLHLTSALFNAVCREAPEVFPRLEWLLFGGEAADPAWVREALEKAAPRRLVHCYGPTESTTFASCQRLDEPPEPGRTVPVGTPIGNTRIHLVGGSLEPVGLGIAGELLIGGDGLARGYLGRPATTAAAFVPDPFGGEPGGRLYRTGDRARWLPAGNLEFLGRDDHQLKIRGHRVELGEIEAALAALPQVRDAVAVLWSADGQEPRLVAYAAPASGARVDEEEVLRRLGERLPEPMLPAAVIEIEALPLTPNGKVDRRALPAPDWVARAGSAEPASPLESRLAALWAEILGLERAGVEDSFFSLGGHSLLAARLVSRIRDELGLEVPLRDLFEAPTVRGLARLLERAAGAEAPLLPVPREPDEALPLSFGQERLWFLDRFEPGTTALNIPSGMRLEGRLHVPSFHAAFTFMVRRHESLRTRFEESGGRPAQRVLPYSPRRHDPPLPAIDLRTLPEEVREAEARALLQAESDRPFDLGREPLMRLALVRLAEERHVLLLDLHHIVSDGWSVGVLLREVAEVYRALVAGESPRLPGLPVQVPDWIAWQRRFLEGEAARDQLAYWRQRLAGDPPPLALPLDRPRPAAQTFRGATLEVTWPGELLAAVAALASRHRATPFMVLLAAFQTLLHRWSGQDDLVVGAPVAGRNRRETEGLVGFFLSSLALRADLGGNPSFEALLEQVRETCLGAFANQDVPFEWLLADLAPERDLSRTPLFQVFFNMLSLPVEAVSLPDLRLEPLPMADVPSKFDLTVYLAEVPAGLRLDLVYNEDLFDAARMEMLLAQYRALLERLTETPEAGVDDVALGTEADRRLLPDPSAPLDGTWQGTVHGLFSRQAAASPERLAVADPAGAWTYGELDRWSGRLAAALREEGVGRGEVVAVWAHRSAPLVWALLGTLEAGAAFLILDPAYPAARLESLIERAEPRAWLAVEAAGPPPERLLAALDALGVGPRLTLPREPADLEASLPASRPEPVPVGPDDLACLGFSSGTSGEPKGIRGRHGSLSHFLPWNASTFGLGPEDRFTMLSGLSHDPLQRDVFYALALGAALIVPDPEKIGEPGYLASWMAAEEVTVSNLTPAMAQLIAQVPAAGPEGEGSGWPRIPSLRRTFLVGDALYARDVEGLQRLAPEMTCVNLFGTTETQRAVSCSVVAQPGRAPRPSAGPLPFGRATAGAQLLILGRAGALAAVGEVGEIAMRSPHLALGYHRDPRRTAERFVPSPFAAHADPADRIYLTGDLGRYLPDGAAAFAGRADLQVQVRGFRIELGEVEAAVAAHPDVAEAAVVAVGEVGGHRLVTFAVMRQPVGSGALRRFLAGALPEHMMPSAFLALDRLPLTPNGKLDRRALARLAEAEAATADDAGAADRAPRGPAEELLARVMAEVLERPSVGRHDSFFDLGGHSLTATQLVSRLRDAVGADLPLRALFEAPTVAGLAERLRPGSAAAGEASENPALEPVPRDGALPLSFAQERLWFLDRLDPESTAYAMPMPVRVVGSFEPADLEGVLERLTERHESLRTRFAEGAEGPVQVIDPPGGKPAVPRVDLSGLDTARRRAAAEELAAREARLPFDLAKGPLLRAVLLRLGRNEHAILLTVHHIVSDGWSMGVLVRELAETFRAARAGEAPRLPQLAVQYADYAAWQRRWLQGDALERQLAYWRETLAGGDEALELPTDRPRRAVRVTAGERIAWALAPEATEGLRALARERGVTLFMVLLGAFQAQLARLSGTCRQRVASPIAGRNHSELEGLIGFFVNTLVLSTDLAGNPTAGEVLARVKEATLGAFAHQDVPFEKLVEELSPERSLSHQPLAQVMLGLQTPLVESLSLPGLELEPMPWGPATAKVDLTLSLAEVGGGLEGSLEYATALFDRSTAMRLLGQLERVLLAFAEGPETPLGALPLLSAAERFALVAEASGKATAYPREATLGELFLARASAAPEAVAVVGDGLSWTYGELAERARKLAARLVRAGVGPELPVALAMPRSAAAVEAVLGVVLAGGVYVPLDPSHPAARRRQVLDDAGVEIVLEAGDDGRIEISGAAPGGRQVPERASSAVHPESRAYVVYTSGSTGVPKGIAVPHRAVVRLVLETDYVALGPGDRVAHASNPAFDAATFEIWGALLTGAALVVVPPEVAMEPPALAETLRRHEVSTLFVTTALFNELARQVPEALAGLRTLLFGGEAVDPQWVRRVLEESPETAVLHVYGPTESTTFATWHRVRSVYEDARTVPIGGALANTRAYVTDAWGELAPLGVAGELLLGGDGLARGYAGRPALTAAAFVPDPFAVDSPAAEPGGRLYRTGDRVRRRPAGGAIEFLGRFDGQVKVRGFRIELGEIEAVLAAHDSVAEAAVFAWEGEIAGAGERRLAAWAVPAGEGGLDPAALREHLLASLPAYMVPAAFSEVASLPLNSNGKVDRRALPAPRWGSAAEGEGEAGEPAWPASPAEELLAGLWAELLGVDRVGPEEDFFALGGHSLLATRLVSRVREALGVELPLRTVFERPTVRALARAVEGARSPGSAEAAAVPIERVPRAEGEDLPLSWPQERLWFLDRLEPGNAAFNMPTPLRLVGSLDRAALAAAFDALVARHESLRTTFGERHGAAVQRVGPPARLELPVVDLGGLPAAASREEAARLQERAALLPFYLAAGPLLRTVLLRRGAEDHLLLLVMHHIVTDGWSAGVLLREVGALYEARLAGRPAQLPELPIQYPDFARWQRRRLEGGDLAPQVEAWRERLGGELPVLDLPTDRPRPALQTFTGGRALRSLPAELSERVRRFGRERGATVFMTLLAAFFLLLRRLAGQEEVLVGSPVAGRNRGETEGLIGFFLNTLVLRADLSGAPGFGEILARVRELALEAYAHQEVPFEKLLEVLAPPRDLSRTPLFQVFFNMLKLPLAPVSVEGLRLEPAELPQSPSKFDLTLYAADEGPRIELNLVYNRDLFDPARAAELLAQYETLLAQALHEPERPGDSLSLLTPAARAVLPDPRAPLDASWRGSVPEIVSRLAVEAPGRTAIVDPQGTWTYGELEAASAGLADALRAAGVERGEKVVVWGHRSAPLVVAVLGVLRAGAAFVIFDPTYPPRRLAELFELAAPAAWIALEAAGEEPRELAAALEGLPEARRLRLPASRAALDVFLSGVGAAEPGPPAALGPDDLAYVAFTSGSTGVPKGILGRHGSLTHFVPWQVEAFGFRSQDRFSLLSGLAHDPLHRDVFTPLQVGASVAIPEPADLVLPGRLAAWVRDAEVTVAHLTPAMGQVLAEPAPGEERAASMPALRWAFFVGDVLTRRDVARLESLAPALTVVNYYGSTESQRAVGYHVVDRHGFERRRGEPPGPDAEALGREILPLGRGIPDVQLLVRNGAGGLAGIGEVGEIWVRSPHIALGYLGDAASSAQRFVVEEAPGGGADLLYRTGDLGRYLGDGSAVFVGRADQQVKLRGFRLELGEIEAILGRHPAVREAVALLREDVPGEPRLVAYFTSNAGPCPGAGELRTFMWERLPRTLAPSAFVHLEALPLTPNGKVDRRALEAPPQADPARPIAAPSTELQEQIAEAWCEVLGLEAVDVYDNFFDLGGHSLLLVRLHGKLQQRLGRDLAMLDLFSYPTVAALAEHMAEREPAKPALAEVDEEAAKQIEAQKRRQSRGRRRPVRVSFED